MGRRKRGTGTVRKRSDGRWEGRVVYDYDDKGLPKTKSVVTKTKRECLEKLEQLREQYAPPITKCKPDMPFGDWIDFWYQNYCKPKLRPSTQLTYEDYIYKRIIPDIGKIPLRAMTQNDLQQFYAKLKTSGRVRRTDSKGEGLSNATVRGCHAKCRMALEKAVELGLIRFNPAIGCKLPPKKAAEMQILTQEEIQRFLIQAKEEGYYELFLLELGTGLRIGELLALQWEDLNFETGALRINKTAMIVRGQFLVAEPKTKSSVRTLMLPESLLNVMREYKTRVNSQWLFPSPVLEDRPLQDDCVRDRMKSILSHANCKQVRFHDLRHTFATMALEHGMDVKTLSAMLGHISSATTLDIYSHVTDTMKHQAAVRIDNHITGTHQPLPEEEKRPLTEKAPFEPYKGKYRKPGTGGVYQINDHLWEGKYSPRDAHGKRISRNVYAKTREECEEKLAAMIEEVKKEIAAGKEKQRGDLC